MSLCDVCKAIPFQDLPPLPEEEYFRTLTGLEYMQTLVRKSEVRHTPPPPRFRHHHSIEDLRRAASEGCELCLLIQGQAEAMLAELDGLEGYSREISDPPPTFDLWLTKRPEGDQGFWVLSDLSPIGPHTIVPVAAFGFVVEDDDVLADTFRGRPVAEEPDGKTLRRLAKWNSECEQNHECCQSSGPIPSRLIDVQTSKSGGTVRLVDFDAIAREKYTALTYASEDGIQYFWEETPLPADGNIQVSSLPKTFQDAISVTRSLNVQYLWIDSLCIPNRQEWTRDSEEAGSVYSNAYLTISATGAENISDGLYAFRSPRTHVRIHYETGNNASETVLLFALPLYKEVIRSRYVNMAKEPLSKGIWAFQERALSSRIVHFASDQLYFECLHGLVSEDGLLERRRFHSIVEHLPDYTDSEQEHAENPGPVSRWCSILWDYGNRWSSDPSERLSALSNIAKPFQRMLNDDYVAGLWRKRLLEWLCWQSLIREPSGGGGVPSWSWTTTRCIPGVRLNDGPTHNVAKIVDMQVSLVDDSKPFGAVNAGSIKLEAPLVPLKLCEKMEGSPHMFLRTEHGDDEDGFFHAGFDTIDRNYDASAELVRPMKLFILVLIERHNEPCSGSQCRKGGDHYGIIVTPVGDSECKMKRVGFALPSSLTFGSGELSSSRRVVTLV